MPKGTGARKRGQKGVDAIFTPEKARRSSGVIIGLAAVTLGALSWTTVILAYTYPRIFGEFAVSLFGFLILSSLGIILVISGTGMSVVYSLDRLARNVQKNSSRVEAEGIDKGVFATKNLRYGFIAFLQSSVVLILYSGLAAEFQSNLSMQLWLRSIFPPSQFLLSNEAIFATAAYLGFLTVQFLPGQAFAK